MKHCSLCGLPGLVASGPTLGRVIVWSQSDDTGEWAICDTCGHDLALLKPGERLLLPGDLSRIARSYLNHRADVARWGTKMEG